jgi:hypothetical protein
LIVHEDLSWLEVNCQDEDAVCGWRQTVLARLPREPFLAERLERKQGCRWSALASTKVLGPVHSALIELRDQPGLTLAYREGVGCITLPGGQPASWAVAEEVLARCLAQEGVAEWELWADGPALRLLVPGYSLSTLPGSLHQALFSA